MTRFFFDLKKQGQSLLDYRGHDFRSSNAAMEFAEAIALDLRHCLTNSWNGWSVEVRNAQGMRFASLQVDCQGLELEAA